MRLVDADVLMATLGITDMDCNKCAWCDKEWSRCKRGSDFEDACCAIENAPTIEERKGKWIIEPYDAQNDIFIHRCGVCMRVAMLGGHTTKFKYCPLCGSAMEGEQP